MIHIYLSFEASLVIQCLSTMILRHILGHCGQPLDDVLCYNIYSYDLGLNKS